MKKLRLVLFLASAFSALAAIIALLAWADRRGLPYNEEGRYFDLDQGVVLHEQSVAIYGIHGIAFIAITIITLILALRR